MNDSVFRIRNLTRKFEDTIVISIPELDIDRGKLVFLLGNSGCGKTTLLETLGLMSQSYDEKDDKSQIVFYPEQDSVGYEYSYLWVDENKLNRVRLEYMSFLFQQTNLFPIFTIEENIGLSNVMQNVPMSDAGLNNRTNELMCKLGLEGKNNNFPNDLSGGQQQRVAFARARLKDFKVLFADEPTGNLGKKDSQNVIKLVRDLVDEGGGEHSAIFVTHDIDLALQYADSLIIMSQDGYVDTKNIFHSKLEKERQWDELGSDRANIVKNVQSIMDKKYGEETKKILDSEALSVNHTYPDIQKGYDKEFKKFYHSKKFEDLSLKGITGIALVTVLLIVWLAIGFSKGSLEYLEQKMSDPFIKWVTVVVPNAYQDVVPVIIDSLNSAQVSQKYSLRKVDGFNRYALFFWDENRKGTFPTFGRTMSYDDPLLSKITDSNNLIIGETFRSEKDFGLIVTQEFKNKFSASEGNGMFVNMSYTADTSEYIIPIPIRAVVRSLPEKSDFISTPFFHYQRYYDSANPFNPRHTHDLILWTLGPEDAAWELADSVRSFFFNNSEQFTEYSPFITRPMKYDGAMDSSYTINVSFTKEPQIQLLNELSNQFKDSKQAKGYDVIRLFTQKFGTGSQVKGYDKLSLNINSLDNVENLKNYLFNNFNLEVDMTRIESLKNYNFIAKLTNILSFAIIIISIFSVCIFVSYLLYTHLYKNRIYIGSFTAFGITDGTMQAIYLKRMTILVTSALFLSFVLASIIGYSGMLSLFLQLILDVENNYLYFNLLNIYPLIFIGILIFTNFVSLYNTAKYFLDHSPGDLIYDRIGKARTSPPVHIQIKTQKAKMRQRGVI